MDLSWLLGSFRRCFEADAVLRQRRTAVKAPSLEVHDQTVPMDRADNPKGQQRIAQETGFKGSQEPGLTRTRPAGKQLVAAFDGLPY